MTDITQNDILEILHAAEGLIPVRPEGALRVEEWREELGWSEGRIRRTFRKMIKQGTAEAVPLVMTRMGDGRPYPTTGYRVKR